MAEFPTAVQPPGGASYSAPLLNFQNFANWSADDPYKKTFDEQQKQMNDAKLQQMQQQIELSKSFAGGLPTDPSTGQIDYRKAAAILASKGDIGGAVSLLQQQPPPLSPMFGGALQGQPQQPGAQPTSIPARPLPPPVANSPKGDSGQGTLTSLVTDRLPAQNQTTGETIMKIAQVMGVDPNATLTPGQQRRAQGLLAKYAPEIAGGPAGAPGGGAGPSAPPSADTGNLPPSANAGTPSPKITAVPPAAPQGGQPAPVAAPQSAPAQPQAQPIVPPVALPPGMKDPQQAILALRTEADRYDRMPQGQREAKRLDAWADRIEESLKPIKLGQYDTYVSPTDPNQIVARGPAAALMSGAAGRSETIESDAEVYRQTGKMPAGIARTPQGQAESHAIRNLAREQEIALGGNPEEWPTRWQQFATRASGRRTLETRAAGLELAENEASSLLPRVREASAKVSRTQYPSINSLIEAAQKGTGGTDVIKLGIAVESLVPVYARVLKPTGQIAQGDMARAHDILDKAWSDGQINAALDQMQVELGSARTALDKTMEEYGVKKPKTDQPDKGSTASTAKWTTLPNGVRIREVSP